MYEYIQACCSKAKVSKQRPLDDCHELFINPKLVDDAWRKSIIGHNSDEQMNEKLPGNR